MTYREETIGDCRLILGDACAVVSTLPDYDAAITDPPYGIGFAAQPTTGQRRNGQRPEQWDNNTIRNLQLYLNIADIQVVWGGNYYSLPPSRGWLSWFKPDAPPSMANFELAWTNQDRNARQISHSISATNAERCGHPTQNPLAVMMWTLGQFQGVRSVVDPFMGSGTTGVACAKLGLKFTGIEIDERYFDIACRRIKAAYKQPDLFIAREPTPRQEALL